MTKTSYSESRQEILDLLSKTSWFKNTDTDLKNELLALPSEFDGFLSDLAARPEEMGGVTILRLKKLSYGNFMAIPVFEVRSKHTNQIFTYEYTSPREGKDPGFKGILLLEIDGEIKYFVLKKTEKFAVGRVVYDTLGGYIQFKNNKLLNLPKKVEAEVKRELGIEELVIKRFIDLGQMNVDVSLTNKHNSLFAAVIDASSSKKIREMAGKSFETKKISFDLIIEPIDKLHEYINKVDDSFFLAAVARLTSIGTIKL